MPNPRMEAQRSRGRFDDDWSRRMEGRFGEDYPPRWDQGSAWDRDRGDEEMRFAGRGGPYGEIDRGGYGGYGRQWQFGGGYGPPGYGSEGTYYGQRGYGYGRGFGRGARYDEGRVDSGDQGWSPGQRGMERMYRGRGPKNYQRSDDRIREDVSDWLTDDEWIDASDIEIKVEGGEVTLTGTVPTREMKRRAHDLADNARGVTDVHNQLKIAGERERGESERRMRGDGGQVSEKTTSKSPRA